jgi:hypothetical protein
MPTRQILLLMSWLSCIVMMGCAMPNPYSATPTSSGVADVCSFEAAHLLADDSLAPACYYCSVFAGTPALAGCTPVAAYSKKDGTRVGPFVRCGSYADAVRYKTANAGSSPAPCVTGYCGPVHVKGYYRKDGTYVRPYTRRK